MKSCKKNAKTKQVCAYKNIPSEVLVWTSMETVQEGAAHELTEASLQKWLQVLRCSRAHQQIATHTPCQLAYTIAEQHPELFLQMLQSSKDAATHN